MSEWRNARCGGIHGLEYAIREECSCPPWQPTARDDDGTPCDFECPDDGCRCECHREPDVDCWCWDARVGRINVVGCPVHMPAPGGVL